jgi:hypothetical protein
MAVKPNPIAEGENKKAESIVGTLGGPTLDTALLSQGGLQATI